MRWTLARRTGALLLAASLLLTGCPGNQPPRDAAAIDAAPFAPRIVQTTRPVANCDSYTITFYVAGTFTTAPPAEAFSFELFDVAADASTPAQSVEFAPYHPPVQPDASTDDAQDQDASAADASAADAEGIDVPLEDAELSEDGRTVYRLRVYGLTRSHGYYLKIRGSFEGSMFEETTFFRTPTQCI